MGGDGTQHQHVQVQRDRCPYCHDPVAPSQEKLSCDGCMAWHHEECWREHGSCSACGTERFSGSHTQAKPERVEGRPRCAWEGCEQPVTSFKGDYSVRMPDRQLVPIQRVCTPHTTQQLRSFGRQNLAMSLGMAAFAAFVTVLILRGTGVPNWIVLPVIFLLGTLIGTWAWRKYARESRELVRAEAKQEAKKGSVD